MINNQIKELQKKVVETHGVTLDNDDPVLIAHTINTKLMEDNARLQQTLLDEYKKSMEEFSFRWDNDVKEKSERILNASLNASKVAMAGLLQESVSATAMTIQKKVDALLSDAGKTLYRAEKIAMINLCASGVTFLGVCLFVIGLVFVR